MNRFLNIVILFLPFILLKAGEEGELVNNQERKGSEEHEKELVNNQERKESEEHEKELVNNQERKEPEEHKKELVNNQERKESEEHEKELVGNQKRKEPEEHEKELVSNQERKEPEEHKKELVNNQERKESEEHEKELVNKKEVEPKVAPSRKIKVLSHITSLTVPTIIFLLSVYFSQKQDDFPVGLFGRGNKTLNAVVFSILSSVVGFYFYLYLESFLSKKMSSGKAGLVSFLLSGLLLAIILRFYAYDYSIGREPLMGLFFLFLGLILSLNSSLLSWFIYKKINQFASS